MTTILSLVSVFLLVLAAYAIYNHWLLINKVQSDYARLENLIDEEGVSSVKEELYHLPESANLGRKMADILEDYEDIRQNKRQFTENASHELQTPLAIIQGHAEILLQSPQLRKTDYEAIDAIMYQLKKVSRLNEALILLTKIEHNGFSKNESISIAKYVNEQIDSLAPLIGAQKLEVKKKFHARASVDMNGALADILIGNLLKNAIKYNVTRGYIKIELTPYSLEIANSGYPLNQPAEQMFVRFTRDDNFQKEEGLGLGLSIVKRICDFYGHKVEYLHEAGTHRLVWTFK